MRSLVLTSRHFLSSSHKSWNKNHRFFFNVWFCASLIKNSALFLGELNFFKTLQLHMCILWYEASTMQQVEASYWLFLFPCLIGFCLCCVMQPPTWPMSVVLLSRATWEASITRVVASVSQSQGTWLSSRLYGQRSKCPTRNYFLCWKPLEFINSKTEFWPIWTFHQLWWK